MTVEDLGFPLTPWPDRPVPVPLVLRCDAELLDDGWVLFTPGVERVHLPEELFLRELLDLDLSDSEAVAFVNDYGVLSGRYGEGVNSRLLGLEMKPKTPPPVERINTHVEDLMLYLKTARVLTRHWVASMEETPVLDAWEAEELGSLVSDEEAAWSLLVECLNAGLGPLRVRVERPYSFFPEYVEGEPVAGLYTGLCVQLFNYLVEHVPVRRCANESCGRAFSRQLGGAVHGQYRSEGVMYCSPSCGNAQWQREHRRKKRAEGGKR